MRDEPDNHRRFTQADSNNFTLSITWRNDVSDENPSVTNASLLSGAVVDASGLPPNSVVPKQEVIKRGTTNILIKRTNDHGACWQ
jgi:hypothetical protein